MAIGTVTYGTASTVTGGGVSLTPGYPASPAAGDLLMVWAYCRATGVIFGLSGWTQLDHTSTANGTHALFYKAAAGGESGTVTVTNNSAANATCFARMMRIPGGETSGTIYSGTITKETEAAATPVTNSGVSPTDAGCLICLFTGKGDGGNATTNDYSAWAGNSLTWSGVANGSTGGTDAAIGIGTAVKSGTGATGNLTATNTLTFVGVSVAVAIKPAATVVSITGAPALSFTGAGAPVQTHNISGAPALSVGGAGSPTLTILVLGTASLSVGAAGPVTVETTATISLSGAMTLAVSALGSPSALVFISGAAPVALGAAGGPLQEHRLSGAPLVVVSALGSLVGVAVEVITDWRLRQEMQMARWKLGPLAPRWSHGVRGIYRERG